MVYVVWCNLNVIPSFVAFSLYFTLVGLCTWECLMHVRACACEEICLEVRGKIQLSLPLSTLIFLTLILRQSLSLGPELIDKLDWLAGQ